MPDRKEHILAEIRRVANLLRRDSITQRDFAQNSEIAISNVRYSFGSWNRAIDLAGLKPNPTGFEGAQRELIPDQELLAEIVRLADELGKPPSENEMNAHGKFSVKPYRKRWGSFSKAKDIAYSTSSGRSATLSVRPLEPQGKEHQSAQPAKTIQRQVTTGPTKNRARFGAPIDFRGVRHAPLNEQGVVYLFGMVSRELGFLIESVRAAFPDCEGKRCVDIKRNQWEQVFIEFEYRSSNFLDHGHNTEECDIIVCWEHDWENCPLEVLELKSAIRQLPNN